jgi:hypothetical protein
VDAPADTGIGGVKFVVAAATCQAVGVELEPPPFIDAVGGVFPDDHTEGESASAAGPAGDPA